ncbi:hypothetical protein ENHYDAX1_130096 [Enhydrobacter sp. AX1]|nr:hypothetical protein ENHYDAX1_130096 [Enhydrobacter sp. AX1]
MKNLSKSEDWEQTDELQKFITQIDEDISNFSFDKADPSSINAAIQKMESEIVTRHPIIIMMPQLLS